MNDKQTTQETGFKVHKLPTKLYDQAALTKEISFIGYNEKFIK